jgi:hypothetical protein
MVLPLAIVTSGVLVLVPVALVSVAVTTVGVAVSGVGETDSSTDTVTVW